MTKYILVGGYVHKAEDGGRAFCEELVKDFSHKKPIKILDCMFARKKENWQLGLEQDKIFFSKFIKDFVLELADPETFTEQVKNSDIIFFQGGIPYSLISILNKNDEWLKQLDGKVLIGTSGGADAISKYYGVGKTGNVGDGLGLLAIKFIPHWLSDYGVGLNINWNQLKEELKNYKEELPIHTLREGEFKVFIK